MTTAWTVTALARLESELMGHAALSAYLEGVETWARDRPEQVPNVKRHGIALIPQESPAATPWVPRSRYEQFPVLIRPFVFVWDATDEGAALTGTDVAGGPTAAQVGLLQFLEDIKDALLFNDLSGLLLKTGQEVEGGAPISTVEPNRDRVWLETTLTWRGRSRFLTHAG